MMPSRSSSHGSGTQRQGRSPSQSLRRRHHTPRTKCKTLETNGSYSYNYRRTSSSYNYQEDRDGYGQQQAVDAAFETPRPFVEEKQSPFHFLYQPHTVSGLLVALTVICYNALRTSSGREEGQTDQQDTYRGLIVVSVVFLVYCAIQLRDGLMVRPHPALWRLVQGCAILYAMGLVYILVQPPAAARNTLKLFDPELGERPESNDKLYASDCRIYTPENPDNKFANLFDTVFDRFMVAHFLGWFGKAIVFRNWKLLLILCIAWELIEYSFQHILKNFHECWWDHWILDVLVCNLGGAAVGVLFCQYFEMTTYDWHGDENFSNKGHSATEGMPLDAIKYPMKLMQKLADQHIQNRESRQQDSGIRSKAVAAVEQVVMPYSWTTYHWDLFSSFKRFWSVLVVLFSAELVELSAFFMKYVLWIPPESPLNTWRLCLWFFLAIPSVREWYQYIVDPSTKRLGANLWIALAVLVVEYGIILKHLEQLQNVPETPAAVVYGWLATMAIVFAWAVLRFYGENWMPQNVRAMLMNFLVVCGAVPLLTIVFTQDVYSGSKFNS